MTRALSRGATVELVSTYILVVSGCGAIVVQSLSGALTHLGVGLTFGLAVTSLLLATAHLGGAHFNPVVTVAFAATGHTAWRAVPLYIAAQCLGAVAAAATLRMLFGPVALLGATLPANSTWQALGVEVLLTAVLLFVTLAVVTGSSTPHPLGAFAIGATVTMCGLWGVPISGGSLNPARSFGPAVVAGVWQAHWVYWAGPLVGALIGTTIYRLLHAAPRPAEAQASRTETRAVVPQGMS